MTARERADAARRVFDRLDTDAQWAVIRSLYGDDELRNVLTDVHDELLEHDRIDTFVHRMRDGMRLHTDLVPPLSRLTLGLFREEEVEAGIARGLRASSTARRLVLDATSEPGVFTVIEDVFNPGGGYFVTADYDRDRWSAERLTSHTSVTVGTTVTTGELRRVEPVLTLGSRVDVMTDSVVRNGMLHLGVALVDGIDVFAPIPHRLTRRWSQNQAGGTQQEREN